MLNETHNLPPPVNHIFVDYENVQHVDPAIIGSKTVHVTLLLGARKTRLDAAVVEKLMQHAATVELVRLKSSGDNALDFTLAYYLGRAVLADPCGYFHIVSADKGFQPLIDHLRSKHVHAYRHDDFTSLTFATPTHPPATTLPVPRPTTPPKGKSPTKPKAQPAIVAVEGEMEKRVLKHLHKPTSNRPRTKKRLLSFLVTHLGHKITDGEALRLLENLSQAGHMTIDEKDKVTYHLN